MELNNKFQYKLTFTTEPEAPATEPGPGGCHQGAPAESGAAEQQAGSGSDGGSGGHQTLRAGDAGHHREEESGLFRK